MTFAVTVRLLVCPAPALYQSSPSAWTREAELAVAACAVDTANTPPPRARAREAVAEMVFNVRMQK